MRYQLKYNTDWSVKVNGTIHSHVLTVSRRNHFSFLCAQPRVTQQWSCEAPIRMQIPVSRILAAVWNNYKSCLIVRDVLVLSVSEVCLVVHCVCVCVNDCRHRVHQGHFDFASLKADWRARIVISIRLHHFEIEFRRIIREWEAIKWKGEIMGLIWEQKDALHLHLPINPIDQLSILDTRPWIGQIVSQSSWKEPSFRTA